MKDFFKSTESSLITIFEVVVLSLREMERQRVFDQREISSLSVLGEAAITTEPLEVVIMADYDDSIFAHAHICLQHVRPILERLREGLQSVLRALHGAASVCDHIAVAALLKRRDFESSLPRVMQILWVLEEEVGREAVGKEGTLHS